MRGGRKGKEGGDRGREEAELNEGGTEGGRGIQRDTGGRGGGGEE